MKTQTRIGTLVLTLALLVGLAPRAEAEDKYWIATGAENWNNTANWSLSSGGAGGAALPGNNDVVFFDGNGTGACSINTAVNVLGINIGSGYSGTITQGTVTITVGKHRLDPGGRNLHGQCKRHHPEWRVCPVRRNLHLRESDDHIHCIQLDTLGRDVQRRVGHGHLQHDYANQLFHSGIHDVQQPHLPQWVFGNRGGDGGSQRRHPDGQWNPDVQYRWRWHHHRKQRNH